MPIKIHLLLLITIGLFALLASMPFAKAETRFYIGKQYWGYQEFRRTFPEVQKYEDTFSNAIRQTQPPVHFGKNHRVKIAVVYPQQEINEYWKRSIAALKARLAERGVRIQISSFYVDLSLSDREQEQYIVRALNTMPDYLIITHDSSRYSSVIEQLVANDKPKIILQNITTPLKSLMRHPLFYVGFDHTKGTQLLVNAYLKKYPQGANFAIFYGHPGYISDMRGTEFKKRVLSRYNMRLVAEFYVGFNREKSRRAAEKLIRENPEIDFIYSCSTDITFGILDSIKNTNNINLISTNGWGGSTLELKAIEQGLLSMTIMQITDDNGVAIADTIINDLTEQPSPQVFSGDLLLVTGQTTQEDLKQLISTAFRYSRDMIN